MSILSKIFKHDTTGSVLLLIALFAALFAENSIFKEIYDKFLNTPVEIRIGPLILAKPLLLWINDALMSVFFFLIGLELKRELLVGQLSSLENVVLPSVAAVLGIVVPAVIYIYLNYTDSVAINGWAIPTATDIAFALGVLSVFGKKLPNSLKILLLTIAIIDDIGAIAIIGIFYSGNLSFNMIVTAVLTLPVLALFNWRNIQSATPYIFVGVILWIAVLKSGVHATLAGLILSMFIPYNGSDEKSLLIRLESDLHSTVTYIILPIFAFANAGINFSGVTFRNLLEPIPLGIVAGLIVGKQIGVFAGMWATVKLKIAKLPKGVTWLQAYGISVLCGIGFTMSLFISSLAFEQDGLEISTNIRLAIVVGSIFSAVLGYVVLRISQPKTQ